MRKYMITSLALAAIANLFFAKPTPPAYSAPGLTGLSVGGGDRIVILPSQNTLDIEIKLSDVGISFAAYECFMEFDIASLEFESFKGLSPIDNHSIREITSYDVSYVVSDDGTKRVVCIGMATGDNCLTASAEGLVIGIAKFKVLQGPLETAGGIAMLRLFGFSIIRSFKKDAGFSVFDEYYTERQSGFLPITITVERGTINNGGQKITPSTSNDVDPAASSKSVGEDQKSAAPPITDDADPTPEDVTTRSKEAMPSVGASSGASEYAASNFFGTHMQYVFGYPDGGAHPDVAITRAEAAEMLYRVIDDINGDKDDKIANAFTDFADEEWYSHSVNYMRAKGHVIGYPDGSYRPESYITRAEFAAIISSFIDEVPETHATRIAFGDVPEGLWSRRHIDICSSLGWMKGYPDGTFSPENSLTRAEAVTTLNRMLERRTHLEDIPEYATSYCDLPEDHWAYAEFIEASALHGYIRKEDGYEQWEPAPSAPSAPSAQSVPMGYEEQ